jgi:hypothetical protein
MVPVIKREASVALQLIGCAKGGERKRGETAHIAAGFGGLASLVHPATVSGAADQFANCEATS